MTIKYVFLVKHPYFKYLPVSPGFCRLKLASLNLFLPAGLNRFGRNQTTLLCDHIPDIEDDDDVPDVPRFRFSAESRLWYENRHMGNTGGGQGQADRGRDRGEEQAAGSGDVGQGEQEDAR